MEPLYFQTVAETKMGRSRTRQRKSDTTSIPSSTADSDLRDRNGENTTHIRERSHTRGRRLASSRAKIILRRRTKAQPAAARDRKPATDLSMAIAAWP